MKMSSACSFIFMQIKVIFIRLVSHIDSLLKQRHKGNWKWPIAFINSFLQFFTIQDKALVIQTCNMGGYSLNLPASLRTISCVLKYVHNTKFNRILSEILVSKETVAVALHQ